MAIYSLPRWTQTYKFAGMFIWSFQAWIDLHPDFNSTTNLAITHMLASWRRLTPNWEPEDETIYLWSATSETGFVKVRTRLDQVEFKKNFYAAVRIEVCFLHVLILSHCRSPHLGCTSSSTCIQPQATSLLITPNYLLRGSEYSIQTIWFLGYRWVMLKKS